jgi:hypothetical protein
MCALLFLLCVLFSVLNAQVLHDPNDGIYKDIDRWSVRGYIAGHLPLIRPYPAQLIDELLSEVIENGNSEARSKASAYKESIAPGSRWIHGGLSAGLEGKDDDAAAEAGASVDGTLRFARLLTASYSMLAYGGTRLPGNELNVPGTYTPYPDFVPDTANVGPVKLFQDWTSMLNIGSDSIYFQAGLSRTSFGPFYSNGVWIGPQAPRAGHFSFNFRREKGSFEILFLALTASDDYGEGFFPEKFFLGHTLTFNPLPSLEVSFQESVIWGGRMEFLYLVPFIQLFGAQSLTDFEDNSFIGFHVRWRIMPGLQFLTQLYIDDFHFNDFIRLKFNTKYKFAGELGMAWTPTEGPLESLDADYTLVFPYMYSHWRDGEDPHYRRDVPNYTVYSHMGRNLGTDLAPNSDRVSLRSSWKTLPDMDLSLSAYFTRHGNPSAYRDDMSKAGELDSSQNPVDDGRHDGSIFDDGTTADNGNNYSTVKFLTQPTLDYRLAAGVGLVWSLPTGFGVFSLKGDYVIEYGWNRELIRDNNGITNYWSIGGSWRW